MDYMDQSVACSACGNQTSSIISKVCHSCDAKQKQVARRAEWDAKSDNEKALAHLESWANPTHMTFDRDQAAFVLRVFREAIATRLAATTAEKERDDLRAQLLQAVSDKSKLEAAMAQSARARPAYLAGLTRYDGGITDHEWGSVGLVEKPVGRAVLLADVQALLAGGA